MITQTRNRNKLVITRLFKAPRELVWKAWTEPELVKKWWGPRDFTAPYSSIDLKVGGKYLSCMRSPDGKDFWSTGVFREIVPQQKLVMSDSFSDQNGNVVPATHYGMSSDFPRELQISVSFEELGGVTEMILWHEDFPEGDAGKEAVLGWNQSFDKLEALLRDMVSSA